MKHVIMIAATSLFIATSANAGGFSFSLPNLWFPPEADVIVTKDALSDDTTSVLPIVAE